MIVANEFKLSYTANEIDKKLREVDNAIFAVATEKAERQEEIAVERARINQLAALPSGSTAGDAELIDIRVGYDGTQYESAGEAVRSQYLQLRDVITDIIGTEKLLLLRLFENAVYVSDQSANIAALRNSFENASTATHTITYNLTNVEIDNDATTAVLGDAYTATLTAGSRYTLDTVVVTMRGVDITATAYYGNGNILIPVVTGDVLIAANAISKYSPIWVPSYGYATGFCISFRDDTGYAVFVNSIGEHSLTVHGGDSPVVYPFELGGGKTFTITCPVPIAPAVACGYYSNGAWVETEISGWIAQGGGTFTVSNTNATHFFLVFGGNGTKITEDVMNEIIITLDGEVIQ